MATEKRMMCVDEFKKNLCHYCNTYMSDEPCEPNECWVHDVIAQTATADAVEVVHGRWDKNWSGDNIVYCNQCYMAQDMPTPYCHSCGAKMDGERKDNEMNYKGGHTNEQSG